MIHFITRAKAKEMIAEYKELKEKIISPIYLGRDILANCETFERSAIDRLLAQPGCVKLRIHYGMDENMQVHSILVGVDQNDNDIIPESLDAADDLIVENSLRCPTICPSGTSLGE